VRLCQAFSPAVEREDPRGCYGNALRCSVELSIFDAYGRLFGEPVSAVTRHFQPAEPIRELRSQVRYGAVIDSGNAKLLRKSLVRRLYGFRDCKVKVGHAGDNDEARLQTIRRWIGSNVDLRVDANEAWSASEAHRKIEPLVKFRISCIEQPVPHAEVGFLAELRRQIATPIMLDESLTSIIDAEAAIAGQTCDLFNIRLSKCGGFLASVKLAARARAANLGYQLGCHPGESGILSAAGRHWACSVGQIRYLEGSYDRHLFRELLTNEDVTFGYGGLARALKGPGLGITINDSMVQRLTTLRQSFAIS
jgi:muconate cycloisomerase